MQRRDETDYDADVPPDAPRSEPVGASMGPGDPMHAIEPEREPAASQAQPQSGEDSTPEPLEDEPSDAVRQEGGDVTVNVYIDADSPESEGGAQSVEQLDDDGSGDVSPPAYDFDTSDDIDEESASMLDGFDSAIDAAAREEI